jgi:hypothetical protein
MNNSISRFVNPWRYRREQERAQRVAELRSRDGEDCRRCRRPLRFDLPNGHDQAPKIEPLQPGADVDEAAIGQLILCHVRCHAGMVDHTSEVVERMRRKNEAALFETSRKQMRASRS